MTNAVERELEEVEVLASRILEILGTSPYAGGDRETVSTAALPAGVYNGEPPGDASRLAAARGWRRVRELRGKHLDAAMFADPAWDILLDVYISRHEGRVSTVGDVSLATHAPASTAIRWIRNLTEAGWLDRSDDERDQRRVIISMSDRVFEKMNALLDDVMESDRKLGLARMHLLK